MRPITSCDEKYAGWIASSGINCRELEAFHIHLKFICDIENLSELEYLKLPDYFQILNHFKM